MKNDIPVINRVLAVFILLMAFAFSIAGIATGICAAFGESFFYSDVIIKLLPFRHFPHESSFPDFLRGFVRLWAGILPALIVNAFSHVMIRYLLVGKKDAINDLANLRKGFFYQLTHPFSNPRTQIKSGDDKRSK